ncbi:MAG TPA: UPF0182 family protein [Acidimicrobiales bacterium]|nr:UPF0182 family protein [Acidimicrobiales bacterium]
MRPPTEIPKPPRSASHARRRGIVIAIILLVAILLSLNAFAHIYTDALWFSSVHLHPVWRSLFDIKAGLMLTFAVIFGVLLFASLMVAERLAPKGPSLDAEDEFVKRYQEVIGPYVRWLRLGLVVVLALIVGSQALGQWNNWILFRNGVPFGIKDPQFGRDVGYYVFKLPFELFLVHWALVALIVILLVTVLFHYLNGGIRLQGARPRVRPAVKAHISVILGLIALVKAAGYYLARFSLDLSSNGYNKGADYADVHARVPAIELLLLVSLAAFLLLIYNIRRQGWALPVIGVGLWFVVALTAGTIYPAIVQALKVNPAQNTLERPYIQRNINATRSAFGLNTVTNTNYAAASTLTAAQLTANADTLANVRLWDPLLTQPTYDKLQDFRSYYQFNSLAVDRYPIATATGTAVTPAIVGVREVNAQDIPSPSWVNTHLVFTHGYGMVVSPANAQTANGDPTFAVQGVPPVSNNGFQPITQPSVYFGLDNSGYVVADTKQPELDYQLSNGTNVQTHYTGNGGVQLSSFFDRLMFALRFGDYNLLISSQLTGQSRLIFDRGVQARVSKAAPFLSLDADPYPALINGHIDWVQDAYTTTDNYPYAQDADTSALSPGSGLLKQFNYVRNSVKVVIDSYTGSMTFYVLDPKDPIIRTYEKAFPGMFTPSSKMPAGLTAHLRYPEDIFTVQASMYGKYHITSAPNFYSAADAWTLSPSPGSGSPSQALQTTQTTNAQGQTVSTGQLVRMAPVYQELRVPGQTQQSFTLLDAFVPVSSQSQIQTLSGFMIAGSDPGQYGKLQMFVAPRNAPVQGPSIVAADIDQNTTISKDISLLNQNGSSVLLGNVLMIPVADALLYIQPLYVASTRNAIPELQNIIAVYGTTAAIGTTLGDALTQVFQAPVSTTVTPGGSSGALSPQVRQLLADAQALYTQSQADLTAGNLGAYQNDINSMEKDLQQVQTLTGATPPPPVGTSTTTTTTAPATTPTTAAAAASTTASPGSATPKLTLSPAPA